MSSKNKATNPFFLLLMFLLVVLGGGRWWIQDQASTHREQQHIAMELATVQQKIDDSLIQQDVVGMPQDTGLYDQMVQDVMQDTDQLGGLEQYYQNISQAPAHSSYQFSLLASLYDASNNSALLPSLFETAVRLRLFDEALKYLQILEDQPGGLSTVDVHTYLFALFNAVQIDFSILNRLKKIVDNYQAQGTLTDIDHDFYYSLITLARGDIDNYAAFMENLRGTSYHEWAQRYDASVLRADSFADTPDYYVAGLVSVGLFQQGWYRIVQHIARSILSEDQTYILAHQLDAYASLMLEDRSQAQESLEYLRSHDEPNRELYIYLAGISLYYQEQYADAILLRNQLHTQKNSIDVLRYRFLAYSKSGDTTGVIANIRQLIQQDTLSVYDYVTMFDELLYHSEQRSLLYIDQMTTEINHILQRCYTELVDQYLYACLYGKAGLHLVMQDHQKVYQYLQHVVARYPQLHIYKHLAETAKKLDLEQEAIQRYIQGLSTASDQTEYDQIKQQITQLIQR